jgi:hypothetical protein
MNRDYEHCDGFCSRGRSVDFFTKYVKETCAFSHLPDVALRGWLLGRLELALFGSKRRSRISRGYHEDVPCPKCKGRGWFGCGRPPCPRCTEDDNYKDGLILVYHPPEWAVDTRFTGADKRSLLKSMLNIGLHKHNDPGAEYGGVFYRALWNYETHCPDWFTDLSVSDDYSDDDKSIILAIIRQKLEYHKLTPRVDVDRREERDGLDERLAINANLIRLALTFGCTCPITGEYIPPGVMSGRLVSSNHRFLDNLSHVSPLGFTAYKRIMLDDYSEKCVSLTPFSDRGKRIINNAVTKCIKALDGEIDSEWVLAEVMQSTLLKRAA